MKTEHIIIAGAGATGLMTAYLLTKNGRNVTVLEARDRTGGRIHTIYNQYGKIELGAEFIHGDLPVTLSLLNEAGIKYSSAGGDFWRFKNGELIKEDEQVEGWDKLIAEMKMLNNDLTLDTFLQQSFSDDKYAELRNEVRRYVSGYDTADPAKASVFALRKEWLNEDEDAQHRLDNGYQEMINFLEDSISKNGGVIKLTTPVKDVFWQKDSVKIQTTKETFVGEKLIVALPLGILQGDTIKFELDISEYKKSFKQIGFGAIIKVICRFKTPFWETVKDNDLKEMGFVLSEEKVPTWWTQSPKHERLLTGWLGGNPAGDLINATNEEILVLAIQSLAKIFDKPEAGIKEELLEWHIVNWTADEFTAGSYAYDMVGSQAARELIRSYKNSPIYFAGEYLYDGPAMGTVEAALTSAKEIASKILHL